MMYHTSHPRYEMFVPECMDALPSSWEFSQSNIQSLDSVLWQIPIPASQEHIKAVHINFCSILDCHPVLFLAASRQAIN